MDQRQTLGLLESYCPNDPGELKTKELIMDFIRDNSDFLGRANLTGHVTGSAWVVNPGRNKVLLTHHRALNKWIQLGGHTEEGEDVRIAALREAREESGLAVVLVRETIFDLDMHWIPESKDLPAHYHYDIRFLLEANDRQPLTVTQESKDLAWVPLDRISGYTIQESVLRMVRKTVVI